MKKSTKVELVSAVAMLLVAAIMMTSASFAWFTLSTAPAVKGVDVKMGVSKNFEIARATTGLSTETIKEVSNNDTGDETAWGAMVTSYGAVTTGIEYGVKSSTAGFETINFGTDGRTNGTYSLLTTSIPAAGMANGVVPVTADITYDGNTYTKNIAVGYGVYLRSNQDITSMTAIITTSGMYCYFADAENTTSASLLTKTVSNGALETSTVKTSDGAVVPVASAVAVSVKILNARPGEAAGWAAQWNDSNNITLSSGVETGVTMSANIPRLAVICVAVDGEYVYANAYTSGSALCFKGFEIAFSSPQITQ